MKALFELKDMLCEELEEIAKKGELSSGELETVHKLTDTIKNIDKIMCLEGKDGYSNGGNWVAYGDYGKGNSYAPRRRDMRGRYTRDMHNYPDPYSRDGAKHEMMEQLEDMMEDTHNEKTREAIRRCMDTIRDI